MYNELSRIRKKCKYTYIVCALVSILLIIIGYIKIQKQDDKNFIFITLTGIIIILLTTIFLVGMNKQKYNEIYKSKFVLPILENVFKNVSYNQKNKVSPSIKKIKEILKPGFFYLNNYLNATYNGITFEFIDIRLIENMINHNTNHFN